MYHIQVAMPQLLFQAATMLGQEAFSWQKTGRVQSGIQKIVLCGHLGGTSRSYIM